MDQQAILEARRLTGEASFGRRPQLPVIKFMGRTSQFGQAGTFMIVRKDEDSGELKSALIGESVEVTILRVRNTADNGAESPRKFVYEFDNPMQEVFLKVEGLKQLQRGSWAQLKEEHPDLRFKQVIYALYGNDIVKIKVKGSSLKPSWDYLGSFGSNDTVFRYKTILGGQEVDGPKGKYWVMTFTRGDEDPRADQRLQLLQSLQVQQVPVAALPAASEVIDRSESTAHDEEEVTAEDIPF